MGSLWNSIWGVAVGIPPDEILSEETKRNASLESILKAERIDRANAEQRHGEKMKELTQEVQASKKKYATQAQPLIDEFDDISTSEHYYDELVDKLTMQASAISKFIEMELEHFGYQNKKLFSVSLNFEALSKRVKEGKPFKNELISFLKDANSEDLNTLATPVFPFAEEGVSSELAIKSKAIKLCVEMERVGQFSSTKLSEEPLGALKFDVGTLKPIVKPKTSAQVKASRELKNSILNGDYCASVRTAENFVENAFQANKKELKGHFDKEYNAFIDSIAPVVAVDSFLRYARASLTASRYACVENTLNPPNDPAVK